MSNCANSFRKTLRNLAPGDLVTEVPLYLCPRLFSRPARAVTGRRVSINWQSNGRRQLRTFSSVVSEATSTAPRSELPVKPPHRRLPALCSGCGALSQTTEPEQAGYFDVTRKAVRIYMGYGEEKKVTRSDRLRTEDQIVQDALRRLNMSKLGQASEELQTLIPRSIPKVEIEPVESANATLSPSHAPLCDRCHKLVHHHSGESIYHPSIDSLRATISESPHRRNHVCHVVDAADFPLSLIPRINLLLDLVPLRSRNRRSQGAMYRAGRTTEMSFVITRSDLLARRKEAVDTLMPWITEVLRSALGRAGRGVRLGNVRCVSAKRGWWTKELKEQIWERGGACWMVGKVNVGKSRLFETVFPKGRMARGAREQLRVPVFPGGRDPFAGRQATDQPRDASGLVEPVHVNELSLLPPAPVEIDFPPMPLVSDVPGTTASPIRVPFGNGRGELIDLPGLPRGDLADHIQPEHRTSILLRSRMTPEQQVIKPGKSLLLGGVIRITPRPYNDDTVFLAYSFNPLPPHLTSTEKATAIQEQRKDAPTVPTIALPGAGERMKHAGSFPLKWDVTRARTGPLTARSAVGLSVDRLPYRVLAVDILIEGVGWVEVVAQVRTRHLLAPPPPSSSSSSSSSSSEAEPEPELSDLEKLESLTRPAVKKVVEKPKEPEPNWPVIDVYSPDGEFVGARRPMNGWQLNKPKKVRTTRPRRSMKGDKKRKKVARRTAEAVAEMEELGS